MKKLFKFITIVFLFVGMFFLTSCIKKTIAQENTIVVSDVFQDFYGGLIIVVDNASFNKNDENYNGKRLECKINDGHWGEALNIRDNEYTVVNYFPMQDDDLWENLVGSTIEIDLRHKEHYYNRRITYLSSPGLKNTISFNYKDCLTFKRFEQPYIRSFHENLIPDFTFSFVEEVNFEIPSHHLSRFTYRVWGENANDFIEDRFIDYICFENNGYIYIKKIDFLVEEDTEKTYYKLSPINDGEIKILQSSHRSFVDGEGYVDMEDLDRPWISVTNSGVSVERFEPFPHSTSMNDLDLMITFYFMLSETDTMANSIFTHYLNVFLPARN